MRTIQAIAPVTSEQIAKAVAGYEQRVKAAITVAADGGDPSPGTISKLMADLRVLYDVQAAMTDAARRAALSALHRPSLTVHAQPVHVGQHP